MSEYIIKKVTDTNIIKLADYILPNDNVFLAGGIFKWLFRFDREDKLVLFGSPDYEIYQARKRDFDLFSYSEEGFNNVKNYFEVECPDYYNLDEHFGSYGTLNNSAVYEHKSDRLTVHLDLVHKFFGSPEEILEQFDFTVTQCALYKKDGLVYLIYSDSFKNDFTSRTLAYVTTPDRSEHVLDRLIKYIDYGFTPSEETIKQGLSVALKDTLWGNVEVEKLFKSDSLDMIKKVSKVLRLVQR